MTIYYINIVTFIKIYNIYSFKLKKKHLFFSTKMINFLKIKIYSYFTYILHLIQLINKNTSTNLIKFKIFKLFHKFRKPKSKTLHLIMTASIYTIARNFLSSNFPNTTGL